METKRQPGILQRIKRLLRAIVLAAILMAIAAGVALFALIRTDFGRARIDVLLALVLPPEWRIRGISGNLPFQGRIDTLEIADAQGRWLTARGIEWEVEPRPLLAKIASIRRISADSLHLVRKPDDRKSSEIPEGSTASVTLEGWVLHVRRAEFREVRVEEAVLGEAFVARLAGKGRWEHDRWNSEIEGAVEWRGDLFHVRAFARDDGRGAFVDVQRIDAIGLSVSARGFLSREWSIEFSVSATNPPILRHVVDVPLEGCASLTGRVWNSDRIRVETAFEASRLSIAAASNGTLRGELSWNSVDGLIVTARHAALDFAGNRAVLGQPLEMSYRDSVIQWRAPSLAWGGISLSSTGVWSGHDISVEIRAQVPDLTNSILSDRLASGRIEAQAHLSGSLSNPVLRAEARGESLVLRLPGAFQPKPADVVVRAETTEYHVNISTEWKGWTDEPLQFSVSVPFQREPDGIFRPSPRLPLAGSLQFRMRLEEIGSFTDLRGSELCGLLNVDLRLGGRWPHPAIAGDLTLRGGRISFPRAGIAFQQMEVDASGSLDSLEIRRVYATDGGGGRVNATGRIVLDPAAKFPVEAKIDLSRVLVWRNRGSRICVGGQVSVEGSVFSPVVTGEVQLVEAEIRLQPSPPPLPRLPIVEDEEAQSLAAQSNAWGAVRLALAVRGREIRVQGRGLDSTWRADFRVDGPADEPAIRGVATVERGFFLFMGRRFGLERAVITLDGRYPPEPSLDVMAVSRAGEMIARLFAVGSIEAPELALESDPPYPVDEILARLLFARSTDTITPLQAVRLAHGLNVLRGRGRTLDVLERGQSVLRVDQLELVQSDEGDAISAISIGKYLGRHVYVEGEKSFDGSADLISVEVELTPSLILTTETGPRMRDSIGLKWRRDY